MLKKPPKGAVRDEIQAREMKIRRGGNGGRETINENTVALTTNTRYEYMITCCLSDSQLIVDQWTSDLLIQHPRDIKMLVCERISNRSWRNCQRILTHSRVAVLMMRMPFLWDPPSHRRAILAVHLGLCRLPLLLPTLKTCGVIFHARTMCVHSFMHC